MSWGKTYNRKKVLLVFLICLLMLIGLIGRLVYLMVFKGEYYTEKAETLHERERDIKAARGRILDAKGVVLADNRTVCTVSVIHSQIEDPEAVIAMLQKELGIDEATARKRVEKVSSIERIKTNVDKEIGDRIRSYGLAGVKVDEDYKRYYPFGSLASKVLGFTGGDNQGIIGLEVTYDEVLTGINGQILTLTDARGIELEGEGERRIEPVSGYDLQISLDYNIQMYAQQAALKVMEEKQADGVSIILMNPQNGEIYAMVNVPEFDLNDPFTLTAATYQSETGGESEEESTDTAYSLQTQVLDTSSMSESEIQDALNRMWRNPSINDTYEPGSTFKIFTAAAGLEEGVVSLNDTFQCGGYRVVEDRRIHCHKRAGHGTETFLEGAQNSCNPVFIDVGLRLGVDNVYKYFKKFNLLEKTGIDLPGEASTIMHKQENVGQVELATISFGQSFQITPIQLLTMASMVVNGGTQITPHFGVRVLDESGEAVETLEYDTEENVLSEETSETMRYILEHVVADGSGNNAYIEGYAIGGKTATSQTLPRSANRYISSFVGFAPADNPQIIGICIINNPKGVYYGGTIAAPVIKDIYENVLPYLGIEKAAVSEESDETES
ncbi:MAG: penicillin-binding transpeptidase domain-containing protein [Lachnospiraceae bacterium]|nr:penicillin-binding transpeptidase domain-containing protein [Lachnospiraceae bacterium]